MGKQRKLPSAFGKTGSDAAKTLELLGQKNTNKEQDEPQEQPKQTKPKKAAQKPTKETASLQEVQASTPDLPEKPTDPGQTDLKFSDPRNCDFDPPTQKEKPKGRRKKYTEPTRSTSYKMPVSVIEQIKELAKFYELSTTEYLIKLIGDDYAEKKPKIDEITRIKGTM